MHTKVSNDFQGVQFTTHPDQQLSQTNGPRSLPHKISFLFYTATLPNCGVEGQGTKPASPLPGRMCLLMCLKTVPRQFPCGSGARPSLCVNWVSLETGHRCTFPACICMFSENRNLRASGWFCSAPDLTHNHKLLKTNKQTKNKHQN